MRKIKNIARPCGDCWTRIEKESFSYRLMCWSELMHEKTENRMYERISSIAAKFAWIDPYKVKMLATAFLVGCIITMIILMFPAVKPVDRNQSYANVLTVVDVQNFDDCNVITFRTQSGFLYTYVTDDGDFFPLETYAAVMDDRGTRAIADDRILSLRYVRMD